MPKLHQRKNVTKLNRKLENQLLKEKRKIIEEFQLHSYRVAIPVKKVKEQFFKKILQNAK
jgi:hypothetical protein